MQRYRRYRGISGLIETTVNRSLVTRSRALKPASRFQIKFFEFFRCRAELAKLIDGCARRRESERLKGFGEQLVEVGAGRKAGADMRIEMLAGGIWNERRNVFDQERVNDAIIRRRDERA